MNSSELFRNEWTETNVPNFFSNGDTRNPLHMLATDIQLR